MRILAWLYVLGVGWFLGAVLWMEMAMSTAFTFRGNASRHPWLIGHWILGGLGLGSVFLWILFATWIMGAWFLGKRDPRERRERWMWAAGCMVPWVAQGTFLVYASLVPFRRPDRLQGALLVLVLWAALWAMEPVIRRGTGRWGYVVFLTLLWTGVVWNLPMLSGD